ncbi:MAG: hypothetical protein CMJ35_12085 [Phycisphaerae bacterium]|nr:hypothetical protein [Phycisphaerae bacterium]MBM92334.1 hypothetical protein [Phycisphaerae bacterium]HCT43857.1 hypothetical protein [Phycisphaerales bacterium]
MLSVALITPRFSETGSSAGYYTHALASLLCDAGIACDVICARSSAPRPGHLESGLLRVHRLPVRKGLPAMGFAAQCAKRVHELQLSNRCQLAICIDAPICADLLRAFPSTLCRVIQTRVEAPSSEPSDLRCLPIAEGIWSPPAFHTPTLLGIGASEGASREQLIRAYRASTAPVLGWSLALLEDDGTWAICDQLATEPDRDDQILLTLQPGIPMLPTLASSNGIANITHADQGTIPHPAIATHQRTTESLTIAIDQAVQLDPASRAAQAFDAWSQALADHPSDAIVRTIRSMCACDSDQAAGARLQRWADLEHQLAHSGLGAAS